jgi:hypothetical protein
VLPYNNDDYLYLMYLVLPPKSDAHVYHLYLVLPYNNDDYLYLMYLVLPL